MTIRIFIILFLLATVRSPGEPPKTFDPAKPFTNGLGMAFVPVPGTKAHFSIHETRLKDYRAFVRETGYVHMRETADPDSRMWSLDKDGSKQRGHSWEDPGFAQTDDHPVCGVSWNDAKAFCKWLTLRERAAGRLQANWEYRLPTDHEWSLAVGLDGDDPKKTPEQKDGGDREKYPWGQWPEGEAPPEGAGNYAGSEAADEHWPKDFSTIPGYRDPFARTAPVGSFRPNKLGIFDLGGNVAEWCEDAYGKTNPARVLRGASWFRDGRVFLLSSCRYIGLPGRRSDGVGFRCVAGGSAP